MPNHKCIYCLEDKDESEFNREHVIPRMMGTYQNGFVLNEFQVCKECNSYFSRELENKIGLNSFESFLRMQHGRPMSDGRVLRSDRVSFRGIEGVFKGLTFTAVVDHTNSEHIHFDIAPCIGILSSPSSDEYNYFNVDDLPNAPREFLTAFKGVPKAIITVGLEEQIATQALREKGYLNADSIYNETTVHDLYDKPDFVTAINFSVDSILRRLCAKTIFNYFCFTNGKDYLLESRFDEIRNYIRFGTWSNNLWFRNSIGPVSAIQLPNESAHAAGYMFHAEKEKWDLCGCLTWFGQLTYVFKLATTDMPISLINILPCTKMACFDNSSMEIHEDEAVYVYCKKEVDT